MAYLIGSRLMGGWLYYWLVHIEAYKLTFIEHIIIFMSEHLHPQTISYQRANQLLEAALLQIQRQNISSKQKSTSNPSPHTHKSSPIFTSPTKTQIPEPQDCHPPLHFDPSALKLGRIVQKSLQETGYKVSSQDSLNEANEISSLEPLRGEQEEQSRKTSTAQSTNLCPNPEQTQDAQSPSKSSQPGEPLLFAESSIKQLKRDLQIKSRGKICRSQEMNTKTGQILGFVFLCKNNIKCPFECSLFYTGQRNCQGDKLLRLVAKCEAHQPSCVEEEEELAFMKLTKLIDGLQTQIASLLSQKGELKPKQILYMLGEGLQGRHRFIYKGLKEKGYEKAAKKYFDNLVYKVKCQLGII